MQAISFLFDAIAGFFSVLLILRFLMQWLRVSFSGQLGSFVASTTNWAVKPLRRLIPGWRGLDWASLLAAVLLQLALHALLLLLLGGGELIALNPLSLLLLALRALLRLGIYVFIGALILQAVLSWVNPYSPLAAPVQQLTRPLLAPLQRIVPVISGIDLSLLVAILLLQMLLIYV
ncbi:YggT family protein [Azonexus sp.]|uniref:YggT family protein n=1 Tax=Azonexus sp. TaxID=1872668 RepID=UPI0039E33B0B